jgi:YidC/Oxa1 family membrane protein insertase
VKDPAKLASETRALFKRHGTSPAAGWLPTLLQAPFFLALYRLIRGLTNSPAGSVTFVPSHLPVPSRLYDALSATHVMRSFGIDLAQGGIAAPQASPASAVILVAVVAAGVVAGLVQQRLASSRARRPSGKRSPVERAVAIAPVLVGVWALWLPGALTIYYAASSALRLFEHWMLPPPT